MLLKVVNIKQQFYFWSIGEIQIIAYSIKPLTYISQSFYLSSLYLLLFKVEHGFKIRIEAKQASTQNSNRDSTDSQEKQIKRDKEINDFKKSQNQINSVLTKVPKSNVKPASSQMKGTGYSEKSKNSNITTNYGVYSSKVTPRTTQPVKNQGESNKNSKGKYSWLLICDVTLCNNTQNILQLWFRPD